MRGVCAANDGPYASPNIVFIVMWRARPRLIIIVSRVDPYSLAHLVSYMPGAMDAWWSGPCRLITWHLSWFIHRPAPSVGRYPPIRATRYR
jgi:hypothetical protein